MVKLLIDYVYRNKIILKLNDTDWLEEIYPLLYIAINNNTEMAQFLIDYVTKNKMRIKLNDNSYTNCTLISLIICHNNLEMFKVLMKYFLENGIELIIDENDIEKEISENNYAIKNHLKNITKINYEILKLINLYRNKNQIKVIFSDNSYFLKHIIQILKE
ncbi:hypothetical protein U3516DRAFT_656009 [Neocallimastix sp. 'constans']